MWLSIKIPSPGLHLPTRAFSRICFSWIHEAEVKGNPPNCLAYSFIAGLKYAYFRKSNILKLKKFVKIYKQFLPFKNEDWRVVQGLRWVCLKNKS